jgi:uncharacterized YigZ family protein
MFYIKEHFTSTYEIKKSKFIAHLVPFSTFSSTMELLKKEHPKARHFVYATRYLNEFDQIVENSSDDGEPKGTSGKPSLAVLSGADVINAAVIIVRYFGGIKLGTGGLVRAYGNAVNEVLSIANLLAYEKLETKNITVNYNELDKLKYNLEKQNIQIINQEFGDDINLYQIKG